MDKITGGKEPKKTIGERHIFTTQLVKLLGSTNIGDIVTYEQLQDVIHMDCRPQGPGYGYQYTARNILEKEANIVFEAVTNIGLKHLPPDDVAKSSLQCFVKPLRSHIKRQKRRVNTLNDDYGNLKESERFCVDTTRTLIAFTSHTTQTKAINQIENVVKNKSKEIGLDDTIALFMPKK